MLLQPYPHSREVFVSSSCDRTEILPNPSKIFLFNTMSNMDCEDTSSADESRASKFEFDDSVVGEPANLEAQSLLCKEIVPESSSLAKWKVSRSLFPDINKKALIAEGKKEVDSLALTLPLPPVSLPKLNISDISYTKHRFVFEGRVLNKYGTYDNKKDYKKYLKADLTDAYGFGTITLVIGPEFIKSNVEKIVVDSCIRVEGPVVLARSPSDGGSVDFSLHFDASTFILKAEPFVSRLVFVPELSIRSFLDKLQNNPSLKTTLAFVIIQVDSTEKSEGGSFEQLTIADGGTALDRATLTFVNKRKALYYQLVDEFHKGIVVPYIARNIGAWKEKSCTLSVLDVTLLAPLHGVRKQKQLEIAFNKQISELGYGKELQGVLRILNFNGAIVVKKCHLCKGSNVCSTIQGGFCYSCGRVSSIDEIVRLVGEIEHSNTHTEVTLVGDIVDTILQLEKPILVLYKEDGIETQILLSDVAVEGLFFVDAKGQVIAFRSPPIHAMPVA